ncbi:thioesterase family protein [Fodinicurvata sp. EGI_FJ10296]|uniref:thioesterase family protein n=1 Tax=Fodinicurvata sp. EGI_FJ10296 TaxID=3231908 RepID=UPI003452220E
MTRNTLHSLVIPSEWIDYNGHMSEGYYALVFSDATDALYLHVGADADWRAANRQSLYTVETHIRYLREVTEGATVSVVTMVVGLDRKRIHLAHELMLGEDCVATQEAMALAVDLETGKSTAIESGLFDTLEDLVVDEAPSYVGRRIALP